MVLMGLGLGGSAWAGPSPLFPNFGDIIAPPQPVPVVDAVTFYNQGLIDLTTFGGFNATNLSQALLLNGFNPFTFATKDTLNWTNTSSGVMEGSPGFEFDTVTSSNNFSASVFFNAGTIEGFDLEGAPYLWEVVGTPAPPVVPVPALSQPIASQLRVSATNIINTGVMAVGDFGLLNQTGNNVTNSFATLIAGSVNTGGFLADPLNTTGLEGEDSIELFNNGPYYFTPSPGVYDLFWAVTNALNIDVTTIHPPNDVPNIIGSSRGFGFTPVFPINFDTGQYSITAIGYGDGSGTNTWYNIIFVNTNFADTNLTATVGFSDGFDIQFSSDTIALNPSSFGDVVQIAEPVFDVITGQIVTNAIYLIDDGAFLPSMTEVQNASEPGDPPGGYYRPNAFEITTETPPDWIDAQLIAEEFATNYDLSIFYQPNEFSTKVVPWEISEYGAQIGRNPAVLNGSFVSLLDSNNIDFLESDFLSVNLPDPTNEPARIEINAGNLDMTQSKMRAEGMVILNVTNLTGGGTAAQDWGEMNVNIGATNGALLVSNFFPTTFQRVRGNIYGYSATWQNLQTNSSTAGTTNTTVTNNIHYHILIVDQNMFGTFPSTIRNLELTGKSTVVLQDNLNVINQAVINTTNLTINGNTSFSQNAATFTPAFTPSLKNLFVNTTGSLAAANILDVGYNINASESSPTGRKYSVNSITNFGQISAIAPLLQAANFENDGIISANTGGSILINANTLSLGLALPGTTNFLEADANVDLSAAVIEASNSVISAGLVENASITLYATEKLTDFVSGVPTTNTNSVLMNFWTTTAGFSLPVKPATGDLFGTEIHTITSNAEPSVHVWAGIDRGAVAAGFVNNEVIGRLVLDRLSTNGVLRFSAAGAANAMYVDYLELTNFALSNYRSGLEIDPNFTIYFADCNLDPEKLMEVYPRLVWVQSFAGPNSTQVVPYLNSSNVCLINAALAQSSDISFFNGEANFYNQPYVLNDPNNPAITYPCPGVETTSRSLLVATPIQGGGGNTYNLLNISVSGEGTVTPGLKASQVVLGNSYALTATAAKGWVFQNWSAIGLTGQYLTNSHILAFDFVSNTVITANFIPNPFVVLQGAYNGLFCESGSVQTGNSGFFTLKLSASGSFSGRLLMSGSTYTFSSQFSASGSAQALARSGAKSLIVNLQLDTTGQTGRILGDVNGGTWDASLAADVAPVWTTKNPSPLAGSYTMALPWNLGGYSYGAGAVTKQGVLTMAGTLADGVAFSASAPVSREGQWPFYAYAPSGKDTVLGWVSVNNGSNGLAGTNITWSKPASKGPLYVAGFVNNLPLIGSTWQAPAKQFSALSLADPAVFLTGGGLTDSLTIGVAPATGLSFDAVNLSLSIRGLSGNFTGWFVNPDTGRRQTMSGVTLQNTGQAVGLFLGTHESGGVLLQNQ
jgi:hypothetical protein